MWAELKESNAVADFGDADGGGENEDGEAPPDSDAGNASVEPDADYFRLMLGDRLYPSDNEFDIPTLDIEHALLNKISSGDTAAIFFYCKTKLKIRGYTERSEVAGPTLPAGGHAPIQIEIINRADQVDKDARPDE